MKRKIKSLQWNNCLHTLPTKFESLFESGLIFTKTLSKLYELLRNKTDVDDGYCKKWGLDLRYEIPKDVWYSTHKYVLGISVNIAIREAFVKIRNLDT